LEKKTVWRSPFFTLHSKWLRLFWEWSARTDTRDGRRGARLGAEGDLGACAEEPHGLQRFDVDPRDGEGPHGVRCGHRPGPRSTRSSLERGGAWIAVKLGHKLILVPFEWRHIKQHTPSPGTPQTG